MEIRTITVGAREEDLSRAAAAAHSARQRLTEAGYTVQTLRLALSAAGTNRCADFATLAREIERLALDAGFDYVSLGPIDTTRLPALAEAIGTTEAVFASARIATEDGTVHPEALHAAAAAIVAIANATPNGFGNLRFSALAGVAPGTPFFPAAYHDGAEPWLAIGPEASALAIEAAQHTTSLAASDNHPTPYSLPYLTTLIEEHDARISAALSDLEQATAVRFSGCDWSLAPYPEPQRSVGGAIELLSGVPFGSWGTLAAVHTLTAAIRAAAVVQLGFSGVMLPVLEDTTLAQRNTEGRYTLRDLLAFSAVCGTGLDTIPLPGATTPAQIAAILLEVATLASKLRKPLTARLMPIPAMQAGQQTTFNFPYFVNTCVMAVDPLAR